MIEFIVRIFKWLVGNVENPVVVSYEMDNMVSCPEERKEIQSIQQVKELTIIIDNAGF